LGGLRRSKFSWWPTGHVTFLLSDDANVAGILSIMTDPDPMHWCEADGVWLELGIRPPDVPVMILTHLHTEHTGGRGIFPRARYSSSLARRRVEGTVGEQSQSRSIMREGDRRECYCRGTSSSARFGAGWRRSPGAPSPTHDKSRRAYKRASRRRKRRDRGRTGPSRG
jgi:hypothetical protein